MKNLDQLSKRILVVAISITMILLSSSLLILTSNKAIATPQQSNLNCNRGYNYEAISGGSYFLIWNTTTGTFVITSNTDNVSDDFRYSGGLKGKGFNFNGPYW